MTFFKYMYLIVFAIILLAALPLSASVPGVETTVDTAEQTSDALCTVFSVVMITWLGIAGYLVYLHRTISRLEKEINES